MRSIVPASPRTAGPVSGVAGPRRSTLSRLARCSGSIAASGSGTPARRNRSSAIAAGHDEVVRGEDGGGVIQRAHRVVQPERPRHQVVGDPLADRVTLGVVGGDGHRAAGDPLEGRADVGERLQGMQGERPGTGRSRGREDVEPRGPRQMRHPLTGTEPLRRPRSARRSAGSSSSGTPSSTSSAARAASAGSRNGTSDRNRDARSRVGPRPETATIRWPARPSRTAIAVPTRPAPTTEMFIAASMPTHGIHTMGPSGAGASAGGCDAEPARLDR